MAMMKCNVGNVEKILSEPLPPWPYQVTNGLDLTPNLDRAENGDDDEHEGGGAVINKGVII